MSLYTPKSLIRQMIMEAEDLTVAPSPEAQGIQDATAASPMDIATDMAPAAPEPGAPGLQGSALSMPMAQAPVSTISKTVINKDIILSQLSELKSVIVNYEKKFDSEDLTPADSNVLISSLLSTLVFHAEKLNAFMETSGGEAPTESMSAPEAAPMPEAPAPEIAPEAEAPIEMPQV